MARPGCRRWRPRRSDKDTEEVDRVLADMAQGSRFDLYSNEIVVLMFDALKNSRHELPAGYAASDWARFVEVSGIASAQIIPSFAPLQDACRESAARRDACLKLAKTMQRSDTVAAQMAGFGIERRLLPPDSKEAKGIAADAGTSSNGAWRRRHNSTCRCCPGPRMRAHARAWRKCA